MKDEEETTAGPSAPAEIEQAFKNVPSERQEPNLRAFSDAFCSEFKAARQGQAYLWQDAKDTQALKRLMKHGLEEFVRRARAGLRTETFGRINTVAQLAAKWNDLAVAVTAPRGNSKQPEAPPLPRYTDEELENLYKPGGLHGFKKPTG